MQLTAAHFFIGIVVFTILAPLLGLVAAGTVGLLVGCMLSAAIVITILVIAVAAYL